jgi:cephalosporin hydroxylase
MTTQKKILTRAEFEELRERMAKDMAKDTQLQDAALAAKVRAGHKYYWVHQTNWMGEPCLQLPQDMFAFQEAVFKSRPDFIIESGVAWGGTMLFLASIMKLLGGTKIIGVDVFIPEDLRSRLLAPENPVRDMIQLIDGSSTDEGIVAKIREIIGPDKKVLVLLDSDHTHDHVLKELRLYAPFVAKGQYLICGDTTIERQPPAEERPRDWGKGNNPATALKVFLAECPDFEVDEVIENKLLLTNNPSGYLKRVR